MNAKRCAIASILLVAIAASAAAFSFVPMSASMAPSGAQSILSFKVTNDTTQTIAVVIKVLTRSMDADGNETNTPVDKEFVVFPARVTVQPNSSQTVKVQYKGNPAISRELCYRVMAEQIPIDFTKQESSGVKVLFRYIAALYVTPAKVSPKLVLGQIVGAEKDGKKGLAVTLKNEGTRHALLSSPVLKVQEQASSMPVTLDGTATAAMDGQNMLPALTRNFFVPWEAAVTGATYTGTFDAEIE
jgi:fimbrial chaperone protein